MPAGKKETAGKRRQLRRHRHRDAGSCGSRPRTLRVYTSLRYVASGRKADKGARAAVDYARPLAPKTEKGGDRRDFRIISGNSSGDRPSDTRPGERYSSFVPSRAEERRWTGEKNEKGGTEGRRVRCNRDDSWLGSSQKGLLTVTVVSFFPSSP